MIEKENANNCHVFQWTTLQRTLTGVNVYIREHQTHRFARTKLVTCLITNFQAAPFPISSIGRMLLSC